MYNVNSPIVCFDCRQLVSASITISTISSTTISAIGTMTISVVGILLSITVAVKLISYAIVVLVLSHGGDSVAGMVVEETDVATTGITMTMLTIAAIIVSITSTAITSTAIASLAIAVTGNSHSHKGEQDDEGVHVAWMLRQ